ncbi:unnamed protein product [Rotaria socialis]
MMVFMYSINIPANAKWAQSGVTIAGGNGYGGATNQLYFPLGLIIDDDQTVVIADNQNDRIMQWKNSNTTNGQVVAGGKGQGTGLHQLDHPTDVLIDKETDGLIICEGSRVVRLSRRSGTTKGEILIDNIKCCGLAMDEQRYLYMISSSFYEYIDRESIDSDLICKICRSPFIDPIVVQCGDTYCRLCIENDMGNGSHCPSQSCNQLLSIGHLTPNPPPRLVVSMLDKLKVRCQLCNETNINRGIFDEHVKTSCSEYRIDCPRKNIGCQWFGSRNEHDEHTKTCLFEKLRPMVDILYRVIENQSLDIEKLQKQTEQQTIEIRQLNTQVDQQNAQFEQQTTEIRQLNTQVDQQKAQLEQQTIEIRQQKTQVDQQNAQFEQQTTEIGQLNTQVGQQKAQIEQLDAQLQQQQIQISDIQSENQTKNNEITSIRKQITKLEEEINKLKSTALWLCK